MLSRQNDTNLFLVGELGVGEMRVGELRVLVCELRVGELRVGKMRVGEISLNLMNAATHEVNSGTLSS